MFKLTEPVSGSTKFQIQLFSSPKSIPFCLFLGRLKVRKSACETKTKTKNKERRADQGCGLGRKSTNLGQPDIGGHDLLPLMLQGRREAAEKAPQPAGSLQPPAVLPVHPQALGFPEE